MKLGAVMNMTMKDKPKPGYTAVTVRESSNPSHTMGPIPLYVKQVT